MNKITIERNQRALLELANQPGNDICADCKSRNPRWTSYNLGIFICVNCASIHRKIGTHITKVKSITLDQWTKEQVDVMRQMGNVKSNAIYNPNETRNPPPTNMIDSERDSELEKYIRAKYEFKSFLDKSAKVASLLGPSRSVPRKLSPAPLRSQTAPVSDKALPASSSLSSVPPTPPAKTPNFPTTLRAHSSLSAVPLSSSQSQPASTPTSQPAKTYVQATPQTTQTPVQQARIASNPVWGNLTASQAPASSPAPPLQYLSSNTMPSMQTTQPMSIPNSSGTNFLNASNPYNTLSVSPHSPFPSSPGQITGVSPGSIGRSMSLNTGLSYNTGMGTGMNGGGLNAFQPSQSPFGPTPLFTPTGNPSPNPFAPQPLQPGMGAGGLQQPSQSFTPFSTSPSGQQQYGQATTPQPQPQPSPMSQTQSLAPQPTSQAAAFHAQMMPQQQQQQSFPQLQMPPSNPFFQQQQQQGQMTMMSQPQFAAAGTPPVMPFGQQQGFPQGPAFGTGYSQGPTGGYPGQQWNGM